MQKYLLFLLCISFSKITSTNSEVNRMNNHVYCVILAGGNGERLWPLSKINKPKQLLEIGSQSTLLDQAINRITSIISADNIFITTTQAHAKMIAEQVINKIDNIIIEPLSRNTGPAILLSCLEIYQKDPEAVVVFVPADPFIPLKDNFKFAQFVVHALDYASNTNVITLLGLKPTYAATGYGYIEYNDSGTVPYAITKFHEKPSLSIAQEYISRPTMLWNIGMFCAKASVFLEEFKTYAPEMVTSMVRYLENKDSYDKVPSISVDYALMEKSKNITVLPADFSWCDVGNIETFLSIKSKYGSVSDAKIVTTNSKNNLIDVPEKLVALVGIDNLCIVEKDNILLITHRDQAENVKDIVKQLKDKHLNEYI